MGRKFDDYIKSKPEIILNGLRKSGITDKLNENLNLDPFDV